jgi:hypothetical protein
VTARPTRRTRRTLAGLLIVAALVVGAGVLTVIGVVTLLDSEAGVAVEADDRPVVALPSTPNGLVGVIDDEGRLTSVVVATLRPEGTGGSVVTFPVNADVDAGFGDEPRPLDVVFDADDPEAFRRAVEAMLAVGIQRVAVVDPAGLAELLEPVVPVDVDLPANVVDSDRSGTGVIAREGRRELRGRLVVAALTAVDDDLTGVERHPLDVAIWSALAEQAPAGGGGGVDDGSAPGSVEELFADLWSGPVAARDIAVAGAAVGGPEDVDAVVLDRRDVLLVFTQVSPALVSKPNQALSFRVVARFDEAQLAESDGLFESNSELMRRVIGELLFFQANPVSTDIAPATEGAPSITRVEVADPRFVDDLEEFAPVAFGESEVVVAPRVIEGVDVVVTLGLDYIETKKADGDEDVSFAADGDEGVEGTTVGSDE